MIGRSLVLDHPSCRNRIGTAVLLKLDFEVLYEVRNDLLCDGIDQSARAPVLGDRTCEIEISRNLNPGRLFTFGDQGEAHGCVGGAPTLPIGASGVDDRSVLGRVNLNDLGLAGEL